MSPRLIRALIVVILLLPLWSFLIWAIRPVRPINIFILDKTVPEKYSPEHRSFTWILTHHKFSKPNRKLYRLKKDYWGMFPVTRGGDYNTYDLDNIVIAKLDTTRLQRGEDPFMRQITPNFTYKQVDSLANQLDMVFFTDMYGIYKNEWFRDTTWWKERSQEIYGGMTQKELYLLKKMKAQQKLILTEFNFYHHPTPPEIRAEAEKLINTKWTHWVGRYFDPLDPFTNEELPRWVYDNYVIRHGGKWPFTKGGIVFARDDDWIEILEDSTHLNVKIPYIYTTEYGQKEYKIKDKVHYPFWFDISLPMNDSNLVISTFRVEPNAKGDSILKQYGIPREFPAIMKSSGPSPYYYFGADFSDNPIKLRPAYFAGAGLFSFAFYNEDLLQRNKFFYTVYRPLLRKIMNDYYKDLTYQRRNE
jgi:hypothetical protein